MSVFKKQLSPLAKDFLKLLEALEKKPKSKTIEIKRLQNDIQDGREISPAKICYFIGQLLIDSTYHTPNGSISSMETIKNERLLLNFASTYPEIRIALEECGQKAAAKSNLTKKTHGRS